MVDGALFGFQQNLPGTFSYKGVITMGFLNKVLDKVGETFRDKRVDNLCDELQSLGIDAQMSERLITERGIELGFSHESLGIIEISEGPITWVNITKERSGQAVIHRIKYGVPDSRLQLKSPRVKIKLVNKRDFPLIGAVVGFQWKGKDSGLELISRLNNDVVVGNTLQANKHSGLTIRSHPTYGCWVISPSESRMNSEVWNCYQTIAHHLLESSGR